MTRGEDFRRFIHSDRNRYTIYVLWLIGFSQNSIARTIGMRKAQVAGIIENSEYRNRSGMADRQRQEFLDELRDVRTDEHGMKLDQGVLDRVTFRIRPLSKRQKREA